MNPELKIFDDTETKKKKTKKQKFGSEFKYLSKKFAKKNRYESNYKSPVYSKKFQSLLDGINLLRRELGYERISLAQAFEQAVALEKKYGFKSRLSLHAGGVESVYHMDKLRKEMNKLGFRPDYSGCHDSGDNSSARNDFHRKINKDYVPVIEVLSFSPLPPVHLDFDTIVSGAVQATVEHLESQSSAHGAFFDAAEGQRALTRAVEQIVERIAPALAEKHVLIDGIAPK